MPLFSEAVKISDGKIFRADYHNERLNRTRFNFFKSLNTLKIEDFIVNPPSIGLYKCRITYDNEIRQVEYIFYKKTVIRTVKVIVDDNIDYAYKYADRSRINSLKERKGEYDDILIIKNGMVKDFSSANILLFDGEKWITPAEPLLPGTHRAYLIDKELIFAETVEYKDIQNFKKIARINAMLDFDEETNAEGIILIK